MMSSQDKLIPTEEMIEAGVCELSDWPMPESVNFPLCVEQIYRAMEAARPTMKIEPADPIVFEDDTGAYARPTTDVSTLDLSLGISRIECEHGYDVCPICDEPDVSTDVLVELRERVRDFIYDCTTDDCGTGWTLSAHQTDDLISMTNASLQRSNAEKDELLTEALEYITPLFSRSVELRKRISKALSHSSETPDAAV